MQVSKFFVPLHSLTKGTHIGELAEWSNAAVLKTVDLNGSGGSNPSLSAKHKEKSRQVYLNATFLFVLCNAPPQAGRDVQRSAAPAQIPESEGLSLSFSSGLSTCKDPTGEVQGMSERSDEIPPQKSVDQIIDQILVNWSLFLYMDII